MSGFGEATVGLITCANCGGKVNADAIGCPNCGANPETGAVPERIPGSMTDPAGQVKQASNQYGNVGRRFAAFIIDVILATVIGMVIYLVIPKPSLGTGDWDSWRTLLLFQGAVVVACWYVYLVASEAIWSATAGKRVLRLHVEMLDGRRCTTSAAAIRNVTKIVLSPWITALIGAAFAREGLEVLNTGAQGVADVAILISLVIALLAARGNSHGQRLGDTLAGTAVVRGPWTTSVEKVRGATEQAASAEKSTASVASSVGLLE